MRWDDADLSKMNPRVQQQIIEKLQQENIKRAEKKPQNKFRNQPVNRGNIRFASKKERQRFDELWVMYQTKAILDLRLQEDYTLQEAYTTVDGKRIKAIKYQADFTYKLLDGTKIVEDVKSRPTKTDVYKMKKKMMQERLGITIQEIE